MSDADEEFRNSKPPKTKELPSQPSDSFMDLDFGYLDPSWPFDQIPTSPVLISTSDQPFSPLWAFADGGGGGDGGSVAASDGGYRISSNGARIVSCNPENPGDEDDKKRVPSSLSGFTPRDSFDVSFIIKERMTQALRYLKESTEHQQILAQVWAPVRNGNRYVLTTSRQPFVFDPHSNGLHQYRTVSLMYMFSVDGESDGTLGLPGRVFRQKLPEWTPDVQYYSSKEYRRVNHAKIYNVRGTLALPVFEPTGLSCVGVLELIMTSQKIHYAPEVDKVCKALEAVNLKSSDILDYPNAQICNEGRQNALAEILEVLNDVCETYKLPLAQTWVPCRHRSVLTYGGGLKKSCSSFDGSCMGQVCMSTTDVAFYVVDAHMWGFREACAEHHLQKAQGVAGRAFLSHSLCFCTDIRRFCKNDYPLVHYARLFGLTSTFAVCLRSEHTGNDDYVLEFFLPPNMTDINELHSLLDDILAEMKQHFQSLMVASGRALEEERENMEIIELPIDESEPSLSTSLPLLETLNGGLSALPSTSQPQLMVEIDAKNGDRSVSAVEGSRDGICLENKETKKNPARKRGKAEKQISLDVLQQYFAGSLKDAAKSLGVCPTTMKRICRQHGISRWPSRKINKVNRSLSKLKRVIESVQGADGAFTLTSLAPSSVPVAVSSISWPAGLNPSNQQESPTSKPTELLDEKPEFPTSKSPGTDGPSDDDHVPHQNGSREASTGTSTSHGSCHGSPGTENTPPNGPPSRKQVENSNSNSTNFTFRWNGDLHLSAVYSMPDALLATHSHEPFGAVLIEDVGSSKDLRNLCTAAAEANIDEVVPEPGCKVTVPSLSSPFPCREEMKTVTIKAMFRDDIIRFRFSLSSNIVELKEEVAKRLKLEVGTFEIKYLDDDHEWVLIACDSDLYECLEISRSSRSNTIRLLIQDMLGNLGSSCESSGE